MKRADKLASQLAKLAGATRVEVKASHQGHTNAVQREQRLVAVMCPLKDCGETFPLKKRGDRSTYNFAKWDRHLHEVHGLRMPTPVDVVGW
jgi:hypothetical protein